MSYLASAALQRALYDRLTDASVPAEMAGIPVVDMLPEGPLPETYIALGPERVRDASTKTSRGAEHRITITVTSAGGGFQRAKQNAGAVSEQLEAAVPALDSGRLCNLDFVRAQAGRGPRGAARSIELIFRAIIDDL